MMNNPVWERKKIGDLFDVQLGKMLNEKAKQGILFPYLANFNVRWGSFNLSTLNEMAFSESERKKFSLKPGDLLMCEGGEIGRCAVWQQVNESLYYQKALHRLRPLNTAISSEFVYYYMQYIATKGELPKLVGETSIAHLTREKLICLLIPVPSRHEQDRITTVLATWDQTIEKTERLIAAKKKRFFWLGRMLISEQKEKLGWYKMKLGDICKPVMRKNNAGETNILTSSAQHGLISQMDYYNKSVSGADLSGYYLLKKGEFAYNRSSANGYPYGAIKRLDYCDQGVFSTLYLCFKISEREKTYSDFLCHYFESGCMNRSLREICQAGARSHGLLNVSKNEFFNLKLFLPPLDQQKQIASILNTATQEIDLLKKRLEAYRKQKRGLMQKLLTGQWRARIKEEAGDG